MAGTATHLAVADLICERLGNDKFNLPLFYSGNIAPDAIHARAGYTRELKKHTHLTVGIGGADFQNPEKVCVFHERLISFIGENMSEKGDDYDLYLGYVCHLVTDEFFNISLRKKMVDAMDTDGLATEGPELAKAILHDMDIIDREIMAKYPFKNDVKASLSAVWDIEIPDMVTKEETNSSKSWVINKLFISECEESAPKYYSYGEALEFITYCAESIIERFKGGKFPALF
ncbi:MAG: hypothetical protein E7660_07950 [Ruminococcaceae bacterium]|nr:hypothetical protein [Oscillospiraceae bacterium]